MKITARTITKMLNVSFKLQYAGKKKKPKESCARNQASKGSCKALSPHTGNVETSIEKYSECSKGFTSQVQQGNLVDWEILPITMTKNKQVALRFVTHEKMR